MKKIVREKIDKLRAELATRFPERADVIDGCIMSLAAREHVLMLGPPGTAKSALSRAVAQAFNASYFERLLTKYSTPDELFGPVSINALKADRFARNITGMLPEAQTAMVDECFKASSAILNSLLALMNERVFHNGGAHPIACPLITLFGASNELPEGLELEALSDRFLAKYDLKYVKEETSFRRVLASPDDAFKSDLTVDDLGELQRAVLTCEVSAETINGLISVRQALAAAGIVASDRRWKKSLGLVRAKAVLDGRSETLPRDLFVLADVLWREPEERNKILFVLEEFADPLEAQVREIVEAARESSENGDARELEEQEKELRSLLKNATGEYAKATIEKGLATVEKLSKKVEPLARHVKDVVDGVKAKIAGSTWHGTHDQFAGTFREMQRLMGQVGEKSRVVLQEGFGMMDKVTAWRG